MTFDELQALPIGTTVRAWGVTYAVQDHWPNRDTHLVTVRQNPNWDRWVDRRNARFLEHLAVWDMDHNRRAQ